MNITALGDDFTLAVTRIPGVGAPRPHLILASTRSHYAFGDGGVLTGPELVTEAAVRLGLHRLTDPFGLAPGAPDWHVELPATGNAGALTGPYGLIVEPLTPDGRLDTAWIAAAAPAATCQLRVAAGITLPDGRDPANVAELLATAAVTGRLAGATINVRATIKDRR